MSSIKILERKLQRGLEDRDYYVAEQSCQTLYHRLTQSRNGRSPPPGDLEAAFETVSKCAKELLTHLQFQAGTSLALLAVKHLVTNSIPVDSGLIDRIAAIADSYVFEDVDHEVALAARKEQLRYLKAAINWSSAKNCAGTEYGDASLNARAGCVASSLEDFHAAQRFFIRSDAPHKFADTLQKWAAKDGDRDDRDVFLTRAVLLYLKSGNIGDANTLRVEFARLSNWPSASRARDSSTPPPLANFCEFLLKSCQLGERAKPLFLRIRDVYEPALESDAQFSGLLDDIAARYFNIQPQQPLGMASMMQSMLRGMMTSN